MPSQTWGEVRAKLTSDATAHANNTTEAVIVPNVKVYANEMQDGRVAKLVVFGKLGTNATPTMTWAIRAGGVGGTLLATTEAITMGSGVTNVNWWLEAYIQTRTNGTSGTLLVWGVLHVHTSATAVSTNVFGVSGYDAPAAVSYDLATADWDLAVTGDWSAAHASNTITAMGYVLEYLN